jgi:hypothetical protein
VDPAHRLAHTQDLNMEADMATFRARGSGEDTADDGSVKTRSKFQARDVAKHLCEHGGRGRNGGIHPAAGFTAAAAVGAGRAAMVDESAGGWQALKALRVQRRQQIVAQAQQEEAARMEAERKAAKLLLEEAAEEAARLKRQQMKEGKGAALAKLMAEKRAKEEAAQAAIEAASRVGGPAVATESEAPPPPPPPTEEELQEIARLEEEAAEREMQDALDAPRREAEAAAKVIQDAKDEARRLRPCGAQTEYLSWGLSHCSRGWAAAEGPGAGGGPSAGCLSVLYGAAGTGKGSMLRRVGMEILHASHAADTLLAAGPVGAAGVSQRRKSLVQGTGHMFNGMPATWSSGAAAQQHVPLYVTGVELARVLERRGPRRQSRSGVRVLRVRAARALPL